MELTERQKQAIARNNAMLRIKNCIATLKSIKDDTFKSYLLKGMINPAIITLEKLLEHMKASKLSSYKTYIDECQTVKNYNYGRS